jgi:hypothetical protein
MVLLGRCDGVVPVYFRYISGVIPFYIPQNVSGPTVTPASPGLDLTALISPQFKENCIFVPLQSPAAISPLFLPLDFRLHQSGTGLPPESSDYFWRR